MSQIQIGDDKVVIFSLSNIEGLKAYLFEKKKRKQIFHLTLSKEKKNRK